MSPSIAIATVLASLAAIEGLSWWWMNPPRAGHGEPVLAYRPTGGLDRRAGPLVSNGAECESSGQESGADGSGVSVPQSSGSSARESIKHQTPRTESFSLNETPAAQRNRNTETPASTSSFTPLPEIYQQAAPMLRCSDGQVFRVNTPDHLTLHLAFFEWNDTDTGSVLEAFRHMPEACLGSLGMTLVKIHPARSYEVRGQEPVGLDRRAGRDSSNGAESQGAEIVDRGSEIVNDLASSSDQQSTTNNHQSSIPPSSTDNRQATSENSSTPHTITFDHSIFEDPDGASHAALRTPVHSFRAVWVAGMEQADARRGIDGQKLDQLRSIRLKAAATRYRPTHARVVQGTVRGALSAEAAWQAFEKNMLRDLTFEQP